MKGSTRQLIFSCEHGGNRIPAVYRHLFSGAQSILNTHRGFDIGALKVARRLSTVLSAPLVYAETSRLLVDLNRSRHHRGVFSEFTRGCSQTVQEQILQQYYIPYRQKLERTIRGYTDQQQPVVHLSIHSFTPKLNGKVRNTDIGLLYDPARKIEATLCLKLQQILRQTGLRVRRNYPYRGSADGMTTYLRSVLPAEIYLGIEVELNQKLLTSRASVAKVLADSLQKIRLRQLDINI